MKQPEIIENFYIYTLAGIEKIEKFPEAIRGFETALKNKNLDDMNIFLGLDYSYDGENIVGSIDLIYRINGELKMNPLIDSCANSLIRANVKKKLLEIFPL